jgi:DNA polymerase-1
MRKVSLIDADSIVYIIAYNHKDSPKEIVTTVCDSFLRDILKATEATHYLGSFSTSKSFREDIYKVALYKGSRPEKPDFFVSLAPLIKQHFIEKHGFVTPEYGIEADDVLKGVSELLPKEDKFTICSPDKDLRQIAGTHFDYRNPTEGLIIVSEDDASYNFWYQMLVGDTTDNIKGVPGLGDKKATFILKHQDTDLGRHFAVKAEYLRYYGPYYGDAIYRETYNTLYLLCNEHLMYTTLQRDFMTKLSENLCALPIDRSDL